MKLAIASDLHLEFGDYDIRNDGAADVLILAGDNFIVEEMYKHPDPVEPSMSTAAGRASMYRNFLQRCSDQFKDVIVVAGNHEFYKGRWEGSLTHLHLECEAYPNVHFLERATVEIDNIVFAGATLWTDCNNYDPLTFHALKDMMNDFREIRDDTRGFGKLKPATTAARHRHTLEYLKHVVSNTRESGKTIVFVGHHAPTHVSIAPEYRGQQLMNGGFVSDLSEFILDHPEIKLWIHGHTHDPFSYEVGDTRVICNPRGYIGFESRARNFELQLVDIV